MIGLAEQFGFGLFATYSVVYTFLIMVAVLAIRRQGHHGRGMSAVAEFCQVRRRAGCGPV